MLSLEEGIKAVKLARNAVEQYVQNNTTLTSELKGAFSEKRGVFTTLHTFPEHDLRGCIGFPLPIMPLKEAIIESAKSATRDPRFLPLDENEANHIIIEVTILTKPELIQVTQPKDYLSHIKIGRDGLIVEQGFYKGLLLPQVPIEQGWEKEEFLSHTCMKAGLLPDTWVDKNTKISKFTGQIFTEIEPKGKIKEKNLDGSDN
ncbi:MAG: TIGR00296 family protein [Thermoplasmatales archaeon]|nr:MAG: TIGR00296 family protein [Thermoplasmatales archaeon]